MILMPSARILAEPGVDDDFADIDLKKPTPGASPLKTRTNAFMRSSSCELLSMALTIYALFARDLMLAGSDSAYAAGTDDTLGYITFVVALLFTLETALNSWTWKGYFPGLFFWLDVVATPL